MKAAASTRASTPLAIATLQKEAAKRRECAIRLQLFDQ